MVLLGIFILVLFCGINHLCAGESLNTEGYIPHPWRNCEGDNLLGGQRVRSLEGCRTLCETHNQCIAFAFRYNWAGSVCWIKSGCEQMGYSRFWTVYVKMHGRKQDCTFHKTPGFALYGHNDGIIEGVDVEVCQRKCLEDTHCLSFEINNNTDTCFTSHDSRETEPSFFHEHFSMTYYHRRCSAGVALRPVEHVTATRGVTNWMKDGRCIKTFGTFGARGGSVFTDANMMGSSITEVTVQYGAHIHRLGFKYGTSLVLHGGSGGRKVITRLHSGEYITGIEGKADRFINKLLFITTQRTIGPFGSDRGIEFSVDGNRKPLLYISGDARTFLHTLNFHFLC